MISRNTHLNINLNKETPFLLKPAGKGYIWGGMRLNDEFAKGIDLNPLAETWECSTHPDGPSVIASGEYKGKLLTEVLGKHPEYLGTHPKTKGELPILIKFIDAKKDLSVQVHPDDTYALKHENGQMGKTEMWYILDAAKDTHLVYGLHRDTDKETLRSSIIDGTIEKYLRKIRVEKDDLFYIEAGTIHAIGAGALIVEIQESSNLTYRLYDYNRIDKNGKKRELHIEKAMEVADLKEGKEPVQPMRVLKYRQGCALELLCRCKYFEVYRMIINTESCRKMVEYQSDSTSFRVLLCINGCGTMLMGDGSNLSFFKGDCIFFPANSEKVKLHGKAQFLDVRGCQEKVVVNMDNMIVEKYQLWCEKAVEDVDVVEELKSMVSDETKIEDAFYRELAFGTGGLRGVIGAGTNRMNVYTVAKASQGLADYVVNSFPPEKQKIAISYDSRIKSDLFAQVAAEVFAGNGIEVAIYTALMPTPCLSFAVRELNCAAGIMITASHNPSKYNGYKVYGADGCQITTEVAAEIFSEINKLDIFSDVKRNTFERELKIGKIQYIGEEVYTAFVEEVKKQSCLGGVSVDKNVAIVYSPLNGAGLKPVLRTLKESGYNNITVVKEQEKPDGNFPTCPYPNPEVKEAMALGIEYARKMNADLLLATDPDCDRVGVAVKNQNGKYELLSGNETGMLLLDYICSRRVEMGTMPEDPVCVKTIVTIDMAERIAAKYGVKTINVLTGFKFIGEQIGILEAKGKVDSYVFGFEESYGYLSGGYVRDKDAVDGAFLICEMFAYYAAQGISLIDKLNELYTEYGYCLNTLHSYEFEGSVGFLKMQRIMSKFRERLDNIGPKKVIECLDYSRGIASLPKSDVLKYVLEDNCSVVVRPSGTEPKLKTYISVSAENKADAIELEHKILRSLNSYFMEAEF